MRPKPVNRRQVSVLQRLLFSFLLVIGLVIVMSGVGLWFTFSAETAIAAIQQSSSLTESVNRLQTSWRNVVESVDRLLLTRSLGELETELTENLNDFSQQLESFSTQPLGMSPEAIATNQGTFQNLQHIQVQLNQAVDEFISVAHEGRWGRALTIRQTSLASAQRELEKKLEELNLSLQAEVASSLAAANRARDLTRISWAIVTILAIGLAVTSAVWAGRGIVRPINQLISRVNRITQGDLSPVAALSQTDEIGDLSRAFSMMTDWLRESHANLENRVAERTSQLERRTLQVQVASEVARDITRSRELNLGAVGICYLIWAQGH